MSDVHGQVKGWTCVCTDGPCAEFPCKSWYRTMSDAPERPPLSEHGKLQHRLDVRKPAASATLRTDFLQALCDEHAALEQDNKKLRECLTDFYREENEAYRGGG